MRLKDHLLEGRLLVIITGLYIALNATVFTYLFYLIGDFSELKLILFLVHSTALLLLFIPVLFGFNRALVRLAEYREISLHIHLFVWSNLSFWFILGALVAGYYFDFIPGWTAILAAIVSVSILYLIPSILLIIIGLKLKNCPDNLFGLLKPIRLSFFWTGILLLTFFLSELAFIASFFNDILLFMLFYKLYWAEAQIERSDRIPFKRSRIWAAFVTSIILYFGSYAGILVVPMDESLFSSDEEELNAIVQEEIGRLRQRELEPRESLREKYSSSCLQHAGTGKQGDLAKICENTVAVLLAETERSDLSAYDAVELTVSVCQRQAEDDESYREACAEDTPWHEWQIFNDAIALALCDFDRAWIFNPKLEVSLSKRGRDVYRDQELVVSCGSRELQAVDYYGFFSDSVAAEETDEDADYEYDSAFGQALDQGREALTQFLAYHSFGMDESYDKQIIDALAYNSEYSDLLQSAIRTGKAGVNFSVDYYAQPLMTAIESGNNQAAETLLNAGADPSIPGRHGILPLSRAVMHCTLPIVELLVEKGADVNGVSGSESLNFAEPLKNAAAAGNLQAVRFLLDRGARLLPENPQDFPYFATESLIHSASLSGNIEVFNIFIQLGATLPASEEASVELMESIIAGKSPAILRQAFSLGLQLPATQHHAEIYSQVAKLATGKNHPQVDEGIALFDLLIAKGLDMSKLEATGWHYGHQAIRYYSRFDALLSDDPAESIIAAKQTRFILRVIEEVLKTGVDIDGTYEKQQTMLMEAAGRAQYEIVDYLLARNADPKRVNAEGKTALDIALEERRQMTKRWKQKEKLRESFDKTILALGGDPRTSAGKWTDPKG